MAVGWMRIVGACLLGSTLVAAPLRAEEPPFRSAKAVWVAQRETEMNLSVGFRTVIRATARQPAVLRLAAASIYRVTVNGRFVGCGPARGPHGFQRVDQWDLAPYLAGGDNLVAIEVAGYNCNSFYLIDQPSFLQAEVTVGPQVLASTAGEGTPFVATVLGYRVQRVQRYSFQRPFIEVYRLSPGWDAWKRDVKTSSPVVNLAVQPAKRLLARGVPYPEFATRPPVRALTVGRVDRMEKIAKPWKDRSLVNVGPALKGFPESELEEVPSLEMQHLKFSRVAELGPLAPAMPIDLEAAQYELFDFGVNLTGLIGLKVTCTQPTKVYLAFDEILTDGDADFKRLSCCNVLSYDLAPGSYDLESIEPYTMRYLKLICREGGLRVEGLHLREYSHPLPKAAKFVASDARLNRLFAAGVETFRQNAVDIFMDCPSRERAGWLCDSFFTARAAFDLTGTTAIEHNFLENFLLPDAFAHLPEGMLPMCYPADHYNGQFILNWALWFVLELEEYVQRSGDRALAEALRPRVMRMLDYCRAQENSDGLMEKVKGWVFVEWSAANKYVQDINYPSNMLYAAALAAAGRVYHVPEMVDKAKRLRETIRAQSFDGKFYVDNALRRDGQRQITRNRSEVCQYSAFFYGVTGRDQDAALWRTLAEEFGPDRAKTKAHPEVQPANAFIGNMLRMELLSQAGRGQQILDESVAYWLYMAERTGTLWENITPTASCNHGFTSHIVHTLYRDVLGIASLDSVAKLVTLRFNKLELAKCEGALPTPDGPVELSWWTEDGRLAYRVKTPAGYRVTVENQSGKEIAQRP